MRTVTYGAACSLDGFIAGSDGAIDWLHFSRDAAEVMRKSMDGVDTFLMGRKTWTDAVARGGGGGSGKATSTIHTYVFSRTLPSIDVPGVHLVRENAGEFVRALKEREGEGKICVMGGGSLAQSLFEAGVIDEVGLNIHPLLLGSGVPLFRDAGRRIALTLAECRVLDGGCVLASYVVSPASTPRRRGRTR